MAIFYEVKVVLFVWISFFIKKPYYFLLSCLSVSILLLLVALGISIINSLVDSKTTDIEESHYLVLKQGAPFESMSVLLHEEVEAISQTIAMLVEEYQIRKDLVIPIVANPDDERRRSLSLRGTENLSSDTPGLSLLDGRFPKVGQFEVLITPAFREWLGPNQDSIIVGNQGWKIVGTAAFDSNWNTFSAFVHASIAHQEVGLSGSLSAIHLYTEAPLDEEQLSAELEKETQAYDVIDYPRYRERNTSATAATIKYLWSVLILIVLTVTFAFSSITRYMLLSTRRGLAKLLSDLGISSGAFQLSAIAEGVLIGCSSAAIAITLFLLMFEQEKITALTPEGTLLVTLEMSTYIAAVVAAIGVATATIISFRFRMDAGEQQ